MWARRHCDAHLPGKIRSTTHPPWPRQGGANSQQRENRNERRTPSYPFGARCPASTTGLLKMRDPLSIEAHDAGSFLSKGGADLADGVSAGAFAATGLTALAQVCSWFEASNTPNTSIVEAKKVEGGPIPPHSLWTPPSSTATTTAAAGGPHRSFNNHPQNFAIPEAEPNGYHGIPSSRPFTREDLPGVGSDLAFSVGPMHQQRNSGADYGYGFLQRPPPHALHHGAERNSYTLPHVSSYTSFSSSTSSSSSSSSSLVLRTHKPFNSGSKPPRRDELPWPADAQSREPPKLYNNNANVAARTQHTPAANLQHRRYMKDEIPYFQFFHQPVGQPVQEFDVRCDWASVNVAELDPEFKARYAYYPKANCTKEEYKGTRWKFEVSCRLVRSFIRSHPRQLTFLLSLYFQTVRIQCSALCFPSFEPAHPRRGTIRPRKAD